MIEFNEHTEFILGRPNFWCAGIANRLRKQGKQIATKAEAEQAAVIFWMLQQYEKYGDNWREEGEKLLKLSPEQAKV